ncbi:MAG TPA: hypothetical protein VEG61_06390, partial [Candidatus Dormibacteraeota bacterium]|nr:hypothetical protein [Candidatus Dormibacteraeota bacterium]
MQLKAPVRGICSLMIPRFIFVEFWPVCALAALRLPGNSPQILWPTFESRGADGTRTYLGEF